MMVLAFSIAFVNNSTVFSPMSRPIISLGILSASTVIISVSFLNSLPHTASIGTKNSTFFSFALSITDLANPMLSSSKRDFPTSYPLAFRKVYAIPPPIIRESTLFSRFSINRILSLTFAPPIIARRGLFGFSTALPKYFTSFSIKNPEYAGMNLAIPAVEQCAL